MEKEDKGIGGYFGFELTGRCHTSYHPEALALNVGRSALSYILFNGGYRMLYLPDYTCEVIKKAVLSIPSLDIRYYGINEDFDPIELPDKIGKDEAILYTNYFALKSKTIQKLFEKYKYQLIVDNAQAFYARAIKGVDTFYTARKFFPVSDGAYLYTSNISGYMSLFQDVSYDKMSHLLKRTDVSSEFGYADFQAVERIFSEAPISKISNLTKSLLSCQDYELIRRKRLENFLCLHSRLSQTNDLKISDSVLTESDFVPFYYPYRTKKRNMREYLISQKVYVPKFWAGVDCVRNSKTLDLVEEIIPLPIDQRYDCSDMERIINLTGSRV